MENAPLIAAMKAKNWDYIRLCQAIRDFKGPTGQPTLIHPETVNRWVQKGRRPTLALQAIVAFVLDTTEEALFQRG